MKKFFNHDDKEKKEKEDKKEKGLFRRWSERKMGGRSNEEKPSLLRSASSPDTADDFIHTVKTGGLALKKLKEEDWQTLICVAEIGHFSESINFLRDFNEYSIGNESKKTGEDLYNTYIRKDAPDLINIDDDLTSKLIQFGNEQQLNAALAKETFDTIALNITQLVQDNMKKQQVVQALKDVGNRHSSFSFLWK